MVGWGAGGCRMGCRGWQAGVQAVAGRCVVPAVEEDDERAEHHGECARARQQRERRKREQRVDQQRRQVDVGERDARGELVGQLPAIRRVATWALRVAACNT